MSHRAKRITALGNAVVPQCAAVIGRAILQAEEALCAL
jgi:site-specific DNA-cytosine methylase